MAMSFASGLIQEFFIEMDMSTTPATDCPNLSGTAVSSPEMEPSNISEIHSKTLHFVGALENGEGKGGN